MLIRDMSHRWCIRYSIKTHALGSKSIEIYRTEPNEVEHRRVIMPIYTGLCIWTV